MYNTIQPTNASFFNQDIVYETGHRVGHGDLRRTRLFRRRRRASASSAAVGLAPSGAYAVTAGGNTLNFQLQSYAANNVSEYTGATSPHVRPADTRGRFRLRRLRDPGRRSDPGRPDDHRELLRRHDPAPRRSRFQLGQATGDTAGVAVFNVGRTNGAPGTAANVDTNNIYSAFYTLVPTTAGKTATSITLPGHRRLRLGLLPVAASVVPEPASLSLVGLSAAALLGRRRRRA